jgi:hypothetical protein
LSLDRTIRAIGGLGRSPRPQLTITRGDRSEVIFTLPPPRWRGRSKPSVLYFSLPKTGTVLLGAIMSSLARRAGLSNVSISHVLFSHGLAEAELPDIGRLFQSTGYCYGFTGWAECARPLLASYSGVAIIRDPRDTLVSLYFSLRHSHPDPVVRGTLTGLQQAWLAERARARTLSLDEHVLINARSYGQTLRQYGSLLGCEAIKIYRYEDVVYDKRRWLMDIADHLQWEVSERWLRALLGKVDVFPDQEDENRHIRQVHPGNYLKKLRPETIEQVNDLLREDMALFGYD